MVPCVSRDKSSHVVRSLNALKDTQEKPCRNKTAEVLDHPRHGHNDAPRCHNDADEGRWLVESGQDVVAGNLAHNI